MARPRSNTATLAREGHSVSLKVLRLSRPSLVQQHPLPHGSTAGIPHESSLAYPSKSIDQDFVLTTSLSLPPAFGSAYIGETFSCTLCANNELTAETSSLRAVSGIRLSAEMQTPTQTFPLQLHTTSESESADSTIQSEPGSSIQRIIRFDLKEEGSHTLSVGVTYSETQGDSSAATSGRARTFRKMYQFVAQPCLSVRTKATELAPIEIHDKTRGPYDRIQMLRYVLEAQLENLSDAGIVLERAKLLPRSPFKSTSLNGDLEASDAKTNDEYVLNPNDVLQVAFLAEQDPDLVTGLDELRSNIKQDGRTVLGQISLQWRAQMGEKGSLNTGNLLTRRRQA